MWKSPLATTDRVSRRTVLSALGATLLGSGSGCVHPFPSPQGEVLQTGILGVYDGSTLPLLTVTNSTVNVRDSVLATKLPRAKERANTTVPTLLNERLEQRYSELYYYADVQELDSNGPLINTSRGTGPSVQPLGESRRYGLSRQTFGKLLVGDRIEYNFDLFNGKQIASVPTIIRRGVIREKRPSPDNNPNTPQYRITVDHGQKQRSEPFTQTYFATRQTYDAARVKSTPWFDLVFEDRTRPTINSFSPDPYGNI